MVDARTHTTRRHLAALLPLLVLASGCSGTPKGPPAPKKPQAPPPPPCPREAPAPPILPDQHPLHGLLGFWLQRTEQLDKKVLDEAQIATHNRSVRELRGKTGLPSGRWDVLELSLDPGKLRKGWDDELLALKQGFQEGKRALRGGARPDALLAALEKALASVELSNELRVVHRTTPLRCYPTEEGIFEKPWELAFDLAQCAQLRTGEGVRVLGKGPTHWYVLSSYARGWVRPEALTPPLTEAQLRAFLHPERFVVVVRDRVGLWTAPKGEGLLAMARLGARFPLERRPVDGPLRVTAPTPAGLGSAWIVHPDSVSVGYRPLTRRRLLRRAFGLLDSPYGWGGMGGHRDCSRFMMDLFGSFGVELPRNSWNQSQAGVSHVDVGELDEAAKARAIEEEARRGIVLLYLKGHIMLYLGRDGDRLYALHQFSGYLVPCKGRKKSSTDTETMMRVNRATVTSLELGRGSSRKSFIERISRLVVLGPAAPSTSRPSGPP